MKPSLFFLLFLVLPFSRLDAQDSAEIKPWPGLSALDSALCNRLVFDAKWVELRDGKNILKVIWVHDARGWKLPNGFYGLKINGEIVDLGKIWIEYEGVLVNLQVLFTHGSEDIDPELDFRDPEP